MKMHKLINIKARKKVPLLVGFTCMTILSSKMLLANPVGINSIPIIRENIQNLTYTTSQYIELSKSEQESVADRWGVTTKEYSKYLNLMEKSPSGKWYSQLNPAEVLGINAASDKERMHYAKIVAKNAHDRVDKELAFQKAYDKAWKILYPNLKPIMMTNQKQNSNDSASLQAGDVLLLFVDLDYGSSLLISRLSYLIKSNPATKLNIYVVGDKASDADIRKWAARNQISPELVQQNIITLNHDKGRFKKLTKLANSKVIPLVILDRNGEFKPIQLSSIL